MIYPAAEYDGLYSKSSDKDLINLILDGDKRPMDTLYKRHVSRIHRRVSLIVRDDDVAWDLTHDTFLKAWTHLRQLTETYKFAGWLARCAVNRAYEHLRRQKIHDSMVVRHIVDWSRPPNDVSDDRIDVGTMISEAHLSQAQYELLVHYLESGLSLHKVAQELGRSYEAVKKMHTRTMRQLQVVAL